MLDGVEGALARGRTVLVGWVLPFGLVFVPTLLVLAAGAEGSQTTTIVAPAEYPGALLAAGVLGWNSPLLVFLTTAAVVLAGGVVANLFRVPLYRILQGQFLWPRALADHRRMSQFVRRNRLRDRAAEHRGAGSALLAERVRRYPDSSDQIAPTLFGNAVRRAELYGFDRFRLDSRWCWQELRSVAPRTVVAEEVRARGAMDFFVCLCWSLVLSAAVLLSLGFAVVGPSWYGWLGATIVFAVAGAVGAYHGAVRASDRWDATVRALVNLGRIPLAGALGLQVPDELDQEREMWRRVNWLVRLDFDERLQAELDPFRQPANHPVAPRTAEPARRQERVTGTTGSDHPSVPPVPDQDHRGAWGHAQGAP